MSTQQTTSELLESAPEQFRRALSGLRRARTRAEITLAEIPSPQKVAPFAVALAADVMGSEFSLDQGAGEELATGRFILLHDPQGNELWDSTFRIVTFIRASVEAEMGVDPMASEVAWAWLVEALEGHDVAFTQAGGTATRVLSQSFGVLDGNPEVIDIELRASWSPLNRDGHFFETHLEAWADMVCAFAGLPPLPAGVTPLPGIRRN